jgi:O-antigen/teichoic acid export membrane protein
MFADLGLNHIMVRDVAGDKSLFPKYFGNANAIKLFLAAVSIAAIYAINIVTGYSRIYGNLIVLMGVVAVGTAWLEYIVYIFNAFEKMHYEAFLKTFSRVVLLAFGFAALKMGAGLDGLLVSMIISYAVSVAVGMIIVGRRIHKPVISFDPPFAKHFAAGSIPIFLSIVFQLAYHHAGVVMLSIYGLPERVIALYSVALKFLEVLSISSIMFATASLPVLSDFYARSRDMFLDGYRRTLKFAFFAGALGAALTSVMSEELVFLVFGTEFAGASKALSVAAWVFIFMFANHAIMQAFIILRKQTINIYTSAAAVCLNIPLNMILIPRYGFMGVAYAVVATEAFLFFMNAWISFALKIRSGLIRSIWRQAVPAVVVALMAALGKMPAGIWGIPVTLSIFAAGVIIMRPFDAEDREYAAKLFSISNLAPGVLKKANSTGQNPDEI